MLQEFLDWLKAATRHNYTISSSILLATGKVSSRGSDIPLPSVDPTLIEEYKALKLKSALSLNPTPYYYDVGYTTINMQNMSLAQFEEVSKLMTAASKYTA